MDAELSLPRSLPHDADGFVRRRCPSCGREFKWKLDQKADRAPWGQISTVTPPQPRSGRRGRLHALARALRPPEEPEVLYCCPYCGQRAEPADFVTPDQRRMLTVAAERELFTPGLSAFAAGLARSEGRSETLPLTSQDETNDMRLVSFACHPDEPIKVADDWRGPLHCLICGEPRVL